MAKKTEVVKNSKTKKQTATPAAKPAVKSRQSKSTATGKPATAPKPTAKPRTRTTASNKPEKEDKNFVVYGTVTYADGSPAVGVIVIAYDNDVSGSDTLGQPTVATASGSFSIPYSEADFRKTKKEIGGADVVVCVYNDKQEILFTSKKKNDAPTEYEVNIKVPAASYVVRGTVTDANQKPLANMLVRAYERDLRHPQLLGDDKSRKTGEFRIAYSLVDYQLADVPARSAPWLIVEVRASSDGEVLAMQEVQKAARDQTVLFTLASVGAVPEWQRISEAVAPLLKGQGAAPIEVSSHVVVDKNRSDLLPYDLTPEDVAFIARDAELDRAAVEAWVSSSRMLRDALLGFTDEHAAEQATLRDNGWPFFYGLARQGLANMLDAVLRESAAKWQQTWRAARAANRVPELNEKQIQSVVDALVLMQRLQQLDPERSGNNDFAQLLASSPLPLPKTVALDALTIYQEKGLRDVEAFLELEKRHPESAAPIKTFVRGVRVHQLVAGDAGFSRVLTARLDGTSDSIEPLAVLPSAEWLGMADEASVTQGHALRVQAQVEKLHPLSALQARLAAGQFDKLGVSNKEIASFIAKDSALADSILRGKTSIKSRIDNNAPEMHKVLGNLGLFARMGLNMEMTGKLMEAGIETPAAAVRYGRAQIRDMWLDQVSLETANDIGNHVIRNAEETLNGANGFVAATYGEMVIQTQFGYLLADENGRSELPESVTENLPTLPGLFGDMDECICKPCESMLGQPAYLVDLLMLLGKQVHLIESRRRDIPRLPLSCENADTLIQHIDIVLEILEGAVVPTETDRNFIHPMAYTKLSCAIFSWGLPFNLHYARVKAYLDKLGVSRANLRSLLASPEANVLAAETLDVSFARTTVTSGPISEWQLLTQKRAGSALWAAYGFDTATGITIVDPASSEKLVDQTVEDLLTRASFLIDRTGLSFEELTQSLATTFVAGVAGGIALTNTAQCKTSQMRLPAEGSVLEEILDRLHRFVRLRKKFPDWEVEQLGNAFVALDGLETSATTPTDRVNLLQRWAIIKRLHEVHNFPIMHLVKPSDSIGRLPQVLGLSVLQFSILKKLTAFDPDAGPFDLNAFEDLCNVDKSIGEYGLSVEQVAETLLPRDSLIELAGVLPPSIKSTEQIENLLKDIQHRLRSVSAAQSDDAGETQVVAALTNIFDALTVRALVNAIRDAGSATPTAPSGTLVAELISKLTGIPGTDARLGEWSPLLTATQASAILSVSSTGSLSANARFAVLLEGVAQNRYKRDMERMLISAVAGQCGQPESEVSLLLSSRLLLDFVPSQSTSAAAVFLDTSFWADIPPTTITVPPTPPTLPSMALSDVPRLHAWMDRLYRLINLRTTLNIDGELMQLAERVRVSNTIGINWHDMLASPLPATGSSWENPNWQALLDMVWLQRPEQLSREVLRVLLARLAELATGGTVAVPVTADVVRPLARRVELSEAKTLAIAAQALSGAANTDNLREPSNLRRVFSLLLLARRLGADATQLGQLANVDNNAQAVATATQLLQPRFDAKEWKLVLQKIEDPIRQQQRDALVAYLVCLDNNDKLRNANDLYEHYLIDPQMEPCFETTRILEAITAVQLLAQRILFGLEEGVSASQELKDRWTWMRNYRVWEANRKVFLFPENWLFPELRDDKSSSFKQLESALGQGELNQDLANQSFGQFLDDVAQMGQIKVLGMYEDVARVNTGILLDSQRFPLRRILYVVGRTQNQPYAYFWRRCVDFGSPHMEWAPWQRIELDVQGDHVMPFVLGGELHVAWPLIRNIKGDSKDIKDEWEAKLAWSRHDGKSWRKSSISRDFWRAEAQPFSDERESFSLRCETSLSGDLAKIFVYALAKIPGSLKTKPPSDMGPLQEFVFNDTTHYPSSASDVLEIRNLVTAITSVVPHTVLVDTLEKFRLHYAALPVDIRNHIEVYWMTYGYWRRRPDPYTLHGSSPGYGTLNGNGTVFNNPFFATDFHLNTLITYPHFITDVEFLNDIRSLLSDYLDKYLTLRLGDFPSFMSSLRAACSRRVIFCYVWIRVKTPSGAADDLLPLNGNKGIFSCVIEGENLTPRQHRDITKLGGQAEATYGLTFTVGTRTLLSTTNETLAAVPAGKLANQKLRFEIDGRDLTKTELEELDINFDSLRTLALMSEFRLTRDDSVAVLSGDLLQGNGTTLGKWVDSSQLWMNGYKEMEMNPPPPLKIIIGQDYEVPIFNSWAPDLLSAPSPFWAVGSASSQFYTRFPLAWHCSENGISRYVDLGYVAGLANNGLFVYPDSYKEATVRRSYWSEYQALEALPAKQLSNFSANEAPQIADNLQTSDWTDAAGGLLAFDARMPYACYNWEVFFHAPLLIADQLSKQHKFEEAEHWLRYVFDPTSVDSGTDAKRFLKFRVFKELHFDEQVIDGLTALAQVAGHPGDAATGKAAKEVKDLIDRWRDTPFRPFVIARRRHIAFLWRTLFAYLDNLIAWADSLYRRDTRESINEATMLYVLAERILGRRPQLHEDDSNRPALNYKEKIGKWDDFANYWIDVGTQVSGNVQTGSGSTDGIKQPNPDGMLYFCMPFNDKISSYWDVVEARLSNVHNCRNIDGITRTLPLMDAQIDPELLIRATAAGLDLSEVISGLYAPPPYYRYSILSARAAELANEAKALGAAMLSAIEKRDAEHLAQLRSSNEISLLILVQEVRTLQITEAEKNIEALRGSRRTISTRYEQYQRLLGRKDSKAPHETESAGEESMLGSHDDGLASHRSGMGLIKEENEQYLGIEGANTWALAANVSKVVGASTHVAGAILAALPMDKITNAAKVNELVGSSASLVGDAFSMVSQGWKTYAEQQGMLAGHIRRRDEWAYQSNQTLKELQQIDKQILANQIRIDITKKELRNHIQQLEQSTAVDEVMRSKFSNEQLYEWMRTQLYGLYSRAYRMALEMARRAERAAARELGVKPLNILGNGYWESQRDGLLAGERLHQDIKRLEVAYLDQNRREFELTKHISLRRLNPEALVDLRIVQTESVNGHNKKYNKCEFEIPEWLFDLDTPGHYLRRIKSVSVSIPGVVGPYTSVNCKLTLLNSHVRHESRLLGLASASTSPYKRLATGDDPRFTDYYGATEAIVTSTANGDSGLFETQLRDERFLPFEGSGVISKWRLELPGQFPQFDYSTISDVVLSIRYTARDGGDDLLNAANAAVTAQLSLPVTDVKKLELPVVLSCKTDFPTEWARARSNTASELEIPVTRSLLPYWLYAARIGINQLEVRRVGSKQLTENTTGSVTISDLASDKWPISRGGVEFAKLGTIDSTVTDVIVVLWVGKA